jgi:hypothetical protein
MRLHEVFHGSRREQATDQRGLPSSYTRAKTALAGSCAHCSSRALFSDGAGVGTCRQHRNVRLDALATRERLRAQINAERAAQA